MKGVSGFGRFAKQLGKGISKALTSTAPSEDAGGGGGGPRRAVGDKGKIKRLQPTLDGSFLVAYKVSEVD